MLSKRALALGAWVLLSACPKDEAAPASASSPASSVSTLADDEHVLFVPTFGTRTEDGWRVPIEAWVFEPEDDGPVRAGMLKVIEKALGDDLDDDTAKRVSRTMKPFLVDNERGKSLVVRAGTHVERACTSEANGRCHGTLIVEGAAVGELEIAVELPETDRRRFESRVHLLDDDGVSVLSDIDDTIKITAVHDKRALIRNTFVHPFRPTPGVVQLFDRWATQGAAFHYVSNSPLPLLSAIEGFIGDAGYPRGSITLKEFRWKDGTFLDLLDAPEDHKQHAIEAHIDRFERRRFILVGDTGERDPEIYAALRRKYGERVAAIFVRDTGASSSEALEVRLGTVFEGLPPAVWTVYTDGSEVDLDLGAL